MAYSGRIVIIGGCGHVGLPLGIRLAEAGCLVTLIDINNAAVEKVKGGVFPFVENGGTEALQRALEKGLQVTRDPGACRGADVFVFVTGTPVDEHLNPKLSDVLSVFDAYEQFFSPNSLIVMRSTLFPGTMEHLRLRLRRRGQQVRLAFCPERVAQGEALLEIESLPQIVSAFDEDSFQMASSLFSEIAPEIIRLSPLEAELTKLMTNSWRYLEFAIANQFYMIAESHGVDFHRIYGAMCHHYPRAKGYKTPGLSAGPCLFKDTMQLASFFGHRFFLGHSAMLVNEGLADFIVQKAETLIGGLNDKVVGLLGMTFKANNDDIRESLSFRVKKNAHFKGAQVLCHDPYLSESVPLKELLDKSDVLILCTPHDEYRTISCHKPMVDIWGVFHHSELDCRPGKVAGEEQQKERGNG